MHEFNPLAHHLFSDSTAPAGGRGEEEPPSLSSAASVASVASATASPAAPAVTLSVPAAAALSASASDIRATSPVRSRFGPFVDLLRQVLPISQDSVFSPTQRAFVPAAAPGSPSVSGPGGVHCTDGGRALSPATMMSRSSRNNGDHRAAATTTLPSPAAQGALAPVALQGGGAVVRSGAATSPTSSPSPASASATSAAAAAALNPPLAVVPEHVAIIMDGNGRWAKSRGMMRVAGHRSGVDAVRDCVRAAGEFGVRYLTLYAFSVENWRRPRAETTALMMLLEEFLRAEQDELVANNVRLQAIGRLSDLPESVQNRLDATIRATSANTGLTLILALSYSGRVEIIEAVRSIAADVRAGLLDPESITNAVLESHLYTSAYPDPDLLIRTSGEMRLSNFLLWQLSYTEIHVTSTLWPDFRREQFIAALQDFASRQRRYGTVA